MKVAASIVGEREVDGHVISFEATPRGNEMWTVSVSNAHGGGSVVVREERLVDTIEELIAEAADDAAEAASGVPQDIRYSGLQ
jgi:hypothetical protein